jgi:D-arabinose 1-dehydrogenase-like Zn-dependent alcohol dehydrogenase
MKAARFPAQGADLEVLDVPTPVPGPGQVLIRVQACGICHGDLGVRAGIFPRQAYPRIPGHEIVGTVEALGPNVVRWHTGDRVGIGWHGWHDGTCPDCRRGNFFACPNQLTTGISFDGGYAQFTVAPAESLAAVPREIPAAEAAPILCAGMTTFNALRNSPARPGDTVGVLGIGGLGHLAVQYAAKMGFHTVALGRGPEKAELARQLGAHEYYDTQNPEWIRALLKRGGAQVILSTATDAQAISAVADGLATHGELLVAGIPGEPIPISVALLLRGRRSVRGWYSGWAPDAEDALRFGLEQGVRAMTESFPLEQAPEAFERLVLGKARFRAVLVN